MSIYGRQNAYASSRLRLLGYRVFLKGAFRKIEVRGTENLRKIPANAKTIIATSHISDVDVGLTVLKLGRMFRIKVANTTIQHHFRHDPFNYILLKIVGIGIAFPVDPLFNPRNFVPMREALENGTTIAMAAHSPTPIKDGKLPPKGGYGAVYLAQISGATIVPAAINIKTDNQVKWALIGLLLLPAAELAGFLLVAMLVGWLWAGLAFVATVGISYLGTLKERAAAEVIIGEPYTPERIEGIDELDPGTVRMLRGESDRLMCKLAQLLPEKRRGPWQEKLKQKQD